LTTLLTGATGFVGSAVLRALVAAGHEVRALARPAADRRNLAGIACDLVEGDLTDAASLARAAHGCEALFHVAADYRLWVRDPDAMERANVAGTLALLRAAAAAGVRRVVYTGTVATLRVGHDGTPSDEESRADLAEMIGPYKRSKHRAEHAVAALARDIGLEVVTVLPTAPIGPRDAKPTPTGRMVVEAASGRMPAFVDTGLNVVHVDDVAQGHLLAFAHGRPGERYILGGDDLRLRAILTQIAALSGRAGPRMRLPHWSVLPVAAVAEGMARCRLVAEPFVTFDGLRMARHVMFFSSDKARRELGYDPRPAGQALADAVAWFREAGYLGTTAR
jgi:dihydroflavonol-4-reductase